MYKNPLFEQGIAAALASASVVAARPIVLGEPIAIALPTHREYDEPVGFDDDDVYDDETNQRLAPRPEPPTPEQAPGRDNMDDGVVYFV